MNFLKTLLDKLNLSSSERTLLKRVFLISGSICIVTVIATIIFQQVTMNKDITETIIPDLIEIDLTTHYKNKSKDLLPIDIDAHKFAAQQHKDDLMQATNIKHLLRILSVEKNNISIKLDLATAYLKAGLYSKAEQLFITILEESLPDTLLAPSMARYGLTLFYNQKHEESQRYLLNTIKKHPEFTEALCCLGQVEASLNMNSNKAEKYFKKAIALDKTYTEAWYQLARYYMNRPDTDSTTYFKARICLKKVIQTKPLDAKTHSRLGMVYYYLHQPDLAEKSYQTALSLNPNDFNTMYNLGELYYSVTNAPAKALDSFKKALALNSNHIEANFKIGLISLENNMTKEAIHFFKTALKQSPTNIRILFQLGVAYEKLGQKKEAIHVYSTILSLDALNDIALQKIRLLNSKK